MRDEIAKITAMVAEGKISAEAAAELIEAIAGRPSTPPPPPPREEPMAEAPRVDPPPSVDSPKDPFRAIFENVERMGRKINEELKDSGIQDKAKQGFGKLKESLEDLSRNIGLGAGETRDQTVAFAVAPGRKVLIENPVGAIRVEGGAATASVRATAKFRAATPEEAKAKAEAFVLAVEEGGPSVVIRQPDLAGVSVDLVVSVPKGVEVEVRGEAGDLKIFGTGAGARLTTRAGEIQAADLTGVVELATDDGAVVATSCDTTSLSVATKAGPVRLDHIGGVVTVTTAAGSVEATELKARIVSVDTVSGKVHLVLADADATSVSVRTVNAPATVELPAGMDVRVAVSTLRGVVHVEVPLTDDHRTPAKVTGRLGAGLGTLDVSSVTGELTVRARDAKV